MTIKIGPEFASYRNPLGLSIGEQVMYSHVSKIDWTEPDVKTLIKKPVNGFGIVCGSVIRCTGKKIRGYRPILFNSDDYEPDTWVTHKRIIFYEVKTCLHHKPKLVHPDDITEVLK